MKYYFFTLLFATTMLLQAQSVHEGRPEIMLLISEYNSKTCSPQCEKRVGELYKSMYNLSALTFPFNSFHRCALSEKWMRVSIQLYSELRYEDNMCVSFKSEDNQCLCFADMINIFNNETQIKGINTVDWREVLAANVTTNERNMFHGESMIYNRQNETTKGIVANNIQLLTSNQLFKQCGYDGMYLCHFPCGNKIGYWGLNEISKKNEYIVPKGYDNVFKLVIIKESHNPMIFYLFISDKGYSKRLDYIKNITESVRFN